MSGRVLIVEDEALIADMVADALTEAGYEVCGIAASEAEALSLGRQKHPDLAVVDVRLAPGDGRNVARQLAERYATTVLMATSEAADTLQQIGAQGVLPKPFSPAVIVPALSAARKLSEGEDPGALPDHMQRLRPT